MNETSPKRSDDRLQLWLRRLILFGPASYLGAVTYIIARRLTYPFELEWMEGGSLIQVLRLLQGKPLYTEPDLSYIPFIYPPFYYYISALAIRLTNNHSFTPLRLVSIVATLGTIVLIYQIVREGTRSRYWGLISAGLFAAAFRLGGAWFDIARVDMLFLFLLVAGTYALIRGGRFSGLLAGMLFALAFYAKQTALLPVAAVWALFLLRQEWRRAGQLGGAFLILSLTLFLVENHASNGWYQYYVFALPSHYQLPSPVWLALFATGSTLIGPLAVALVLGFLPLVMAPRDYVSGNRGIMTVLTLSAVVIAIVGDTHVGGYDNAKLPALASVTIMAGLGGAWLETLARSRDQRPAMLLLYGLLAVQFAVLHYDIAAQVPSGADRQAGEELLRSIAETPGEILVPYHGYLALLAGKQPSAHQVMLWDLHGNFGEMDEQNWPGLEETIAAALQDHRFSRILLDREDQVWQDVPRFYVGTSVSYPGPDDFYPVTGGRARPNLDFLPR
jgi:dolichyl-phosphate-mannose-protein mannosyltransferase